ncbi:class I SAM-dependent methyltransferase [Sedimentibacter sp. B4]|uniref:class I SAM-dependent methyltransferase n=1 Tax=Sedimentibacter sp. B4 TaxID=304766 RepID=UPI0002D86938|nr:class I SAM-dependent methyltransferase [Sedimentibacter sp. B4]
MGKRDSMVLFNSISQIYGMFYKIQKKRFKDVIEIVKKELDIKVFKTILDVGCGTGALCSVLNDMGLKVTGVDPAEKMLNIAREKPENKMVNFAKANILERLPFEDKLFDASIASYVAHGMGQEERKLMYAEMSRVSKSKVIIYDYNEKRSLPTTIIEWLEGGDYFNFIKNAESEMRECFSDVKTVYVGVRATWYICTPK